MVRMPAFCPSCGLIFESGFEIRDSRNVTFQNVTQTCPRCRRPAELPDGTFDVIDETIHVLSASGLTLARLRLLAQILDAVRAEEITEDEAETRIRENIPEAAPVVAQLRRRMGKAGMFFLTAVVSALIAHGVDSLTGGPASKSDVAHAVEQAITYCKANVP